LTKAAAQFDFGENWREFSMHALAPSRVEEARTAFRDLVDPLPLPGRTFLDIGFGQGLSLLAATAMGARTVGCDINPKCELVLRANHRFFDDVVELPPVVIGSILDADVVTHIADLAESRHGSRLFDVVHAWGVLHHTGDMQTALAHAASLVTPGGHLILALYNRHWTSPIWRVIKRAYVASPRLLQRAWSALFYPVIMVAKWAVTRRNPLRQERGMDFYYDVVDWVGGYPYEYASCAEVEARMSSLGFSLVRRIPARVPTGCNEFVLRRAT
jgi:2-polyprenyl-3-methyl-5-hydroxy-6-metoxy-1,4-benzoquinol methylase